MKALTSVGAFYFAMSIIYDILIASITSFEVAHCAPEEKTFDALGAICAHWIISLTSHCLICKLIADSRFNIEHKIVEINSFWFADNKNKYNIEIFLALCYH